MLENLIGEKIEIFEREASSLVFAGEYANTDPLVDHFRLKELYFSEDEDNVIQRYGIRWQDLKIKALLKACSCDWRMWNHRAETSKTAALYRSEKEFPQPMPWYNSISAKPGYCFLQLKCGNTDVSRAEQEKLMEQTDESSWRPDR